MSNKGWIKLDRKILNSSLWNEPEPFDKRSAWIDLLLYVSWKDTERVVKNKVIKIKRGSQFVSDNFLANRWHWSRGKVRRYIKMLENAGMINIKRTADGTCINVVNYSKFQDARTADDTSDDTTHGTTGGTTDGTQYKKYKNDKEYIRTRARARTERFNNHDSRDEDMDALELALLKTN